MDTTENNKFGPAEWVELIASSAERLRKVGVLTLKIDKVEIHLAPAFPDAPPSALDLDGYVDDGSGDPLNDPMTYGRNDGRVPGYEELMGKKLEKRRLPKDKR